MITSEMNIELAIGYITGSASEAERISFDEWLNESDNHRHQFEAFRSYWEITSSTYDDYEPDLVKGWEKVSRETVHKKVATFRQKSVTVQFMRIAAVLLLLLAGWYGSRLVTDKVGMPESQLFVYHSIDMLKKIQLTDGTTVWLNQNSNLYIPAGFNRKSRKIQLEGEAYFEVAGNPDKPFYITAANTITRVVGTSFNVRAHEGEDKVKVTVYSGEVSFYPKNRKSSAKLITAGDRGVYSTDNHKLWKETVNSQNDLAWKTGYLQFKDAPLADVCAILSNYYGRTVKSDPEISDSKKFTGNFYRASLKETLDVISLTLDIEFVNTDSGILAQP
jgi:transmembrane sensor